MEIRATVTRIPHPHEIGACDPLPIKLLGGQGVGRVTRPGLAAPVGEAAINPVPRRMIESAVRQAIAETGFRGCAALQVVISAPEGEERARRTMNARLGIVGGISILGTTGIVIPMSAAAWTATIDACLDVARAAGARRALLAFGRTSERAGQAQFPDVAENAAVLMGDHVGYALDAAAARDLDIVIAGQFAKFCKLAGGSFDTHVRDGALDPEAARALLLRAGFSEAEAAVAAGANTAREIFEHLLAEGDRGVFALLAQEVAHRAADRIGHRVAVEAALFDYGGRCLARVAVGRDREEK
jgi:cobalt-precorrin-5B (C1)-methyltransferase